MSTFLSLTPWMGSVVVPTAGVATNLQTLLLALSDGQRPGNPAAGPNTNPPENLSVQQCVIQLDPGSGSSSVKIGGPGMTSTFYGSKLLAGQALPIGPFESNLIQLRQIYLYTDADNLQINVTLVRR